MAAKRSSVNYAADREYLARVSAQTGLQINAKSDSYAHRLASRFRAQERAGVPLSRQAARGHRVTPEHGPRGAKPKLPAPVVKYGGPPKSKYVKRTVRLRHRRPRVVDVLPFEGGSVYTVREEREVWDILAQWHADDRMTLTGFDCSTGSWITLFANEGHGRGATIGYVRELVRGSGLSLEDFMVLWTQDEYRGAALTHVCLFQVHVYDQQKWAARPQFKRRRG